MATNIHMGYMGHCKIGGTQYLITGSSLNPVQTVNAPDLVQGFEMRKGWNYAKVEIGGNVTGPLHEYATSLWGETIDRSADHDHLLNPVVVDIAYYKGEGLRFENAWINSLEIAATAGEVVNFTADFLGSKFDESAAHTTAVDELTEWSVAPCSKLVTWDRVQFTAAGVTMDNIQSFTLTVNNNLERIYSIKDGVTVDLYPVDVVAGIREVTGSVSLYAEGPVYMPSANFPIAKFGAQDFDSYQATDRTNVTFRVGGANGGGDVIPATTIAVVFHRPEASAVTGPTIYTLNYTAVCDLT